MTRKGFPTLQCLTLTLTHKTGGVTFRACNVVVPLHDDTGALVSLQLINSNSLKRTLKDCQVKGACHIIYGKKQAGNAYGLLRGMRPRSPCIN